jgi:hypothetical protein
LAQSFTQQRLWRYVRAAWQPRCSSIERTLKRMMIQQAVNVVWRLAVWTNSRDT